MWEELIFAIETSNIAEAEPIIERIKPDELDRRDKLEQTALILAASKGLGKTCEQLISKMNPDTINAIDKHHETALTWATFFQLDKVCEILIDQMSGDAISSVNQHGRTALTWTIIRGKEEMSKQLISRMTPESINALDSEGSTVLFEAALRGQEKICEILIHNMNPETICAIENVGDTALTWAAFKGHEKICEMLIHQMSRKTLNAVNKNGDAALNAINQNGDTALTLAASNGLEKICEMLIPKMCSEAITNVTKNRNTALTRAASKGFEKICEMLIPKMSPEAINAINNTGSTALTWAADKNLEELCVDLIFKMTPKTINSVLSTNGTALNFAAKNNMAVVCKMLLPRMDQKAIATIKNYEIIKKLQASQIYINEMVSFILFKLLGNNNPELKIEECYKYTIYQENKNQIAGIIGIMLNDSTYLIKRVDNYILKNYFKLAGICKELTSYMSKLPEDCVNDIISSLGPCSLLAVNHIESDIYLKVKDPILNKVQKLSKAGRLCVKGEGWHKHDSKLIKYLGTSADDYSIKIAKMMCFEAINLGIRDSNNQDLTCALEFAKAYPELINKIIFKHPKYFVSAKIAKACIDDVALQNMVIAQLPLDDRMEHVEPIYHLNLIGDSSEHTNV